MEKLSEEILNWQRTVRRWTVRFEVRKPMESLPRPDLLVYERQHVNNSTTYFLDCSKYPDDRGGQLNICVRGEGELRINGAVRRIRSGDAFCYQSNDPAVCYYRPSDVDNWEFLWMSFVGDAAERMIHDINRRYGYCFHLPDDCQLLPMLLRYADGGNVVHPLSPLAAAHLVTMVFAAIGDGVESRQLDTASNRLVTQIHQLIADSEERFHSVNTIAATLHVSREHLSRLFHKQTGMSLAAYLMRERINLATRLLCQSAFSCKEIANHCGFENPASFTRAFIRETGMAPSILRSTRGGRRVRSQSR